MTYHLTVWDRLVLSFVGEKKIKFVRLTLCRSHRKRRRRELFIDLFIYLSVHSCLSRYILLTILSNFLLGMLQIIKSWKLLKFGYILIDVVVGLLFVYLFTCLLVFDTNFQFHFSLHYFTCPSLP